MNRSLWIAVIIALVVGLCLANFLTGLRTETYRGRVLNEATGAPLPDTVVTVIWTRAPIISIEGGHREYLSAQETTTSADGKFVLQVSPGLDWNPFTFRNEEPWIVIFKPGYKPLWYGTRVEFGYTADSLVADLKKGLTVLLPRSRQGQRVDLGELYGTFSTSHKEVPRLFQAINDQRHLLGMTPIPDSELQ